MPAQEGSSLFVAALFYSAKFKFIILLSLLLALTKFRSWSSLPNSDSIRIIACSLVFILTWNYAFSSVDYAANDPRLLDRFFLIGLAFLALCSPIFIIAALLQSLLFLYSFETHALIPDVTDKIIIIDGLVLFFDTCSEPIGFPPHFFATTPRPRVPMLPRTPPYA